VHDETRITVEEASAVTRKLTVEVPAAEVDQRFGLLLKDYRRKAVLPGFRKGKVPAEMVRRLYAGDITADVARALISANFAPALEREGLDPVSEPEFEIVTLEEGKPFVFRSSFEVRPRFELAEYTGVEIDGETVEVKEEDVERLLEELRISHATVRKVEEARGVRDGDVALIEFEGRVEGAPVPNGSGKDFPLVIGSNAFPPGFEDNLIGALPGERREFMVRLPRSSRTGRWRARRRSSP